MSASHVAVVLIHGIGDLRRLDVLSSAKSAVAKLAPDAKFDECFHFCDDSSQQVSIDALSTKLVDKNITLVEFYWAQIVGKIRLNRPIRSYFMFFNIFWSAPMLAIQGYGHERARFYLARVLGAWFCLCLATLPFIGAWALIEEGLYWVNHCRHGINCLFRGLIFGPIVNSTGFMEVYFPMMMLAILVFLLLTCQWVVSEGIALFWPHKAGATAFWRVMFICGLLVIVIMIGFGFLVAAAYILVEGFLGSYFPRTGIFSGVHDAIPLLKVAASVWPYALGLIITFVVAAVVGNLIRDVIYYLAPNGEGGLREHQSFIQAALWRLIDKIQSSGVDQIVLVAHSLGTVILIDTLIKYGNVNDRGGRSCPIHIITAGSPIRRLILRLVPHRLKNLPALIEALNGATAVKVVSWLNTYRLFDYVGQALGHTALIRRMPNVAYEQNGWFQDHPLRPLWHLPLFHSNYWGDSRFVELVAVRALALEKTKGI